VDTVLPVRRGGVAASSFELAIADVHPHSSAALCSVP
jgi:hypothetical protein